jgi:hypothetical protein
MRRKGGGSCRIENAGKNRVYYQYTKEFVDRKKFHQFTAWCYFWLILILLFMSPRILPQLEFGHISRQVILFFSLPLFISPFVLMTLANVGREYHGDQLFIEEGLIHFIKSFSGRNCSYSKHYTVYEVTRFVRKGKRLIIYGKVTYQGQYLTRELRKVIVPDALEKRDEFIQWVESGL